MVAKRWVTSAVRAPMPRGGAAASQPAWPPPMTMTSNAVCMVSHARLVSRVRRTDRKAGTSLRSDCFT